MIVVPLRRRHAGERLLHEGIPIEADFQGVNVNSGVSVNGRCPFRITAQWQDPSTARVHVFQSRDIWFDPSKYINQRAIRVFVDKINPKRYYVDLSFLPKIAD
jgi:hypothetical protein